MPTKFVPNEAGFSALGDAIDRGVAAFAFKLADRAREIAPVASGKLRDSIRVDRDGEVTVVVAEVPYAVYVELGTADTPAQPFLNPALDQLMPSFGPTLRKEIASG